MEEDNSHRTTVAALDLGSNSFHMIIARVVGDDLHVLDRMREPIRLAEGLDDKGRITEDAERRALASLERMGQRMREIPSSLVRAVGTNTLRQARNGRDFRSKAERVLGHPIEVISGLEEARLIYSGVAHSLSHEISQRLVVDIGGGSTEIIIGEGYEILRSHSLFMGCVTYSQQFFRAGVITRDAFRSAETAAGLELRTVQQLLKSVGWQAVVGASGTVHAVAEILRANGFAEQDITLDGMKKLRKACTAAGSVAALAIPGLKPDRAPVLAGGLAILISIFKSLEIDRLKPSPGALREGLLYEIVGRLRHEDVRDRTIRRLVDQYHVDLGQSARVERTALQLLHEVKKPWGLEDEEATKLLLWAARLHEIGLAVAYTGSHKHGAYLVKHGDMPGFSRDDQVLLASLIGVHRRKIPTDAFVDLPPAWVERVRRLAIVLRLAVLLNRSRIPEETPRLTTDTDARSLELIFPPDFLEGRPLTVADLAQEAAALQAIKVELRFSSRR